MGSNDSYQVNLDTYDREAQERKHIIESCPIDIYCSSINPRWSYPHRLMSFWETRSSVADSAEEIIIDSGYRRYGNMKQILTAVDKVDADYFILPDITPNFYCYDDIEPEHRALEFARHLKDLDRWRGRKTSDIDESNKVLVPLHRPFDESLDALMDPELVAGEDNNIPEGQSILDVADGVAIGLKEMPVPERIEVLGLLDRRLPNEKHVHALSPGTEMEMLGFLRENPHMLDSLDISTPENAAKNNKIPDNEWHQHKVPFPSGTDVSTLRAMRSLEIALRLNYMLSDLCNDSEFSDVVEQTISPVPADD